MRIRMLTTSAGPDGVMVAGREYEISDEQARELLPLYAVRVDSPRPKAAPVEVAAIEPQENAAIPEKRRGRRPK